MRVPQNLSEVTIDKYIKAIDIIENEDVELVVMLRLLNLFSGKSLEQQGILPKNGLRNAIILNREVSKTNFIMLVGEEAANLDSFEILSEISKWAIEFFISFCIL